MDNQVLEITMIAIYHDYINITYEIKKKINIYQNIYC